MQRLHHPMKIIIVEIFFISDILHNCKVAMLEIGSCNERRSFSRRYLKSLKRNFKVSFLATMIDDARDRSDEVRSASWFAGPTEKRIRRHFPGVLTNDHTYLSDSQFDEWKLRSLSKPELNAHVERSPSNRAAHVAFIIAIESKVREDGPE